ncbi:MAG: tetratricopeptide repeat protein, partial [Spirochaetales bacterium]
EEQFTAAIEIQPDYPFAYSDRGMARALQYHLSDAEADLTVAVDLNPGYYWHHIDRGRVRMELRKFPDAITDFTEAIAINPRHFLGYAQRASASDALERYEDALRDYREVLRIRPDYYPAWAPIAVSSFVSGDYALAFTYFDKAFQREDSRWDLALLASLSLKHQSMDKDSERYLLEIVNTIPRDMIHYDMVRYYLAPGHETYVMAQVQAETNKLLKGQMYFYLGAQMELLGRIQTAQAAFLEAENLLQPGFVERRLASWRLQAYRTVQEGGS